MHYQMVRSWVQASARRKDGCKKSRSVYTNGMQFFAKSTLSSCDVTSEVSD